MKSICKTLNKFWDFIKKKFWDLIETKMLWLSQFYVREHDTSDYKPKQARVLYKILWESDDYDGYFKGCLDLHLIPDEPDKVYEYVCDELLACQLIGMQYENGPITNTDARRNLPGVVVGRRIKIIVVEKL